MDGKTQDFQCALMTTYLNSIIIYGTRVFKKMVRFRMFFQNALAVQPHCKPESFLRERKVSRATYVRKFTS